MFIWVFGAFFALIFVFQDRMAGVSANGGLCIMPDGFSAVPISIGQESAPLKLCVLVRQKLAAGAGGAGNFLILRDTLDGLIYLGCITDASGRVRQWVELWVQDSSNLSTALPTAREAVSNSILDARWRSNALAMESALNGSVIRTGWEETNPPPTFIDLASLKPVHPTTPDTQKQLQICRDDAALMDAQLPSYSGSLHRYLYVPASLDSKFFPVLTDSPTNDWTLPLATLFGGNASIVPFNPGAGLMFARESVPLKYTSFVDFLGGSPAEETLQLDGYPGSPVNAGASSGSGKSAIAGGYLFLGQHGSWGRAVEGFHLKLCAITSAISAVREVVKKTQFPMLNLTADSFRVRANQAYAGLPWLWTAIATVVTPGDVVELPIKSNESKYYLFGRDPGMSVYRPPTVGRAARGRAMARLRKVMAGSTDASGGSVILEGTLAAPDALSAGHHDLLWLRFNLGPHRLDLYANLEAEVALTQGEWRFRTVEQHFSTDIISQLQQAEGVSFPDVMFDVLPSMNAPCDLYALAVLAVRTLLVNGQRTLPVALDELLSLARAVALDARTTAASNSPALPPLPERLAVIFKRDPRWMQSLGPQHMAYEPIPVEQAFDLIPRELWFSTLAAMIRMLPGIGPDSEASDYGQGRVGGLDHVFDHACDNFEELLLRSRSMIVIDWKYNREIDAVLRNRLAKISGSSSTSSGAAASVAPVQNVARESQQRLVGK